MANGSLDLAIVRLEQEEILELARRPLFVEDLYHDPLVLTAAAGCPGFDEFQALPIGEPEVLVRVWAYRVL